MNWSSMIGCTCIMKISQDNMEDLCAGSQPSGSKNSGGNGTATWLWKSFCAWNWMFAKIIKGFCAGGGYLFAMCSGAETFDIAVGRWRSGHHWLHVWWWWCRWRSGLDFTKTLAFETLLSNQHQQAILWPSTPAVLIFMSRVKIFFGCLTFQPSGTCAHDAYTKSWIRHQEFRRTNFCFQCGCGETRSTGVRWKQTSQ